MNWALLSAAEASAARWRALGLDVPGPPPADARGRTALHEAAHAVARYLLGGQVARVTATAHGGFMEPVAAAVTDDVDAAIASLDAHGPQERERQLLLWLHELLAGPAAEALVDARADWDGEKDREALACVRELYPRALGGVPLSWHFTRTMRLLARPRVWHALRTLAGLVVLCPELTGERVHAVLDAGIGDLRGRWVPRALGDGEQDQTWLE